MGTAAGDCLYAVTLRLTLASSILRLSLLPGNSDYRYSEDRVVVADNLITSRGPGTSFLFALTIVEKLLGQAKRDEIAGPMVLSDKL